MIDYVFYILTAIILCASIGVVLFTNPLYSALSLAGSMVALAAMFFKLDAHFIAAVQLVVYAGAVMVLFVMVLMLFDLKHEPKAFTRGVVSGFLKIASCGVLCGLIAGSIFLSTDSLLSQVKPGDANWVSAEVTRDVSVLLFSKYIFGFEAMGVLLLVIAIGAVALSRIKGGTHAQPD